MTRLLAPLAAVIAALALAAPASAAVRTGSVDDPLDQQVPSLQPEYSTDLQHVDISYDDTAGIVTAAATFYQGEYGDTATITLTQSCDTFDSPVPTLTISLIAPWSSDEQGTSTAELEGYDGTATSATQISGDLRTISASFSNPAFANRDWRCVAGSAGNYANDQPDDFGPAWLQGYEPQKLTPTTAVTAAAGALTAKYGAAFVQSSHRWLACPAEELFRHGLGSTNTPILICQFEFSAGASWRAGEVDVSQGALGLTPKVSWLAHPFTKTLRHCHLRASELYVDGIQVLHRHLSAGGYGGCSGHGLMVSDLDYSAQARFPRALRPGYTTYMHGTDLAGYPKLTDYRCHVSSRLRGGVRHTVASCANALDDRYRYAFDLQRRPAPAPRPRQPAQHHSAPAPSSSPAPASSCPSGYTPATIGGGSKCLHGGEFCSTSHASEYPAYGYQCVNGRLESD